VSTERDPLVSAEWLAAHLQDPDLRVVDATWYLPHLKRDPRAEYLAAHIPGAVFFDIDEIKDPQNPLPHMLPSAADFARAVGALGIGDGDRVVVYGGRNGIAAARVWWTFRVFGYDRVAVLDGGLAHWRAQGHAVEQGPVAPATRRFSARLRSELVRDLETMRGNLESRGEQVLDARSSGRFLGTEPELRPDVRSGHIPGSLNLPYDRLFRADDGAMLEPAALGRAFADAGVNVDKPVVTTCGSGVSACVLALALYRLGRRDVPIYDGSWTEWGGRADTPVTTDPPRSP
jgi:thiosulfate/3-mercaptopyruvate sulfurtransferase